MAILDNGKIAVGKTVCNHQTIGGLGRVRLSKSLGKTNFRGTATVAFLTVMMAQIGCHNAATTSQPAIDTGDENVAKTKLAEAEPLYENRADLTKARVAVATLRQAQVADYGNYEVAWKLSRAAFYVAQHTDNDDERDETFREGIQAGLAAVKLQPDKPDGHFWLGANYGGTAEHSTLAGLANVEDIKREMDAVIKIDESYQGGSAYLGLGRLYLRAPRVLGGDVNKAIEYLEKGLRLGPNNTLIRVDLAEAYEAAGRHADALKQIEAVLTATPDPKYAPEHNDAVAKAKKLLQKMESR
jgi:tetratricopeptide (TPR) repeat protein